MLSYFNNNTFFPKCGLHGVVRFSGEICLSYGTRNDKFASDKVNWDDDNYSIQLDGVLLNKEELYVEYNVAEANDLLICLWEEHGANLIRSLKGSYTLVLWDKRSGSILITNDWCSKRCMYYYIDCDNGVNYSSSFFSLVNDLKNNNIPFHIDNHAIKSMCANGVMNAFETYVEEIKFLAPFEYIFVNLAEKTASVKKLSPKADMPAMSFESCVEMFDNLFSKAVKLQFSKNSENCYRQVATISGGMDSRSCVLEGISHGFREIDCFSYAQSNSIDFEVAQAICMDHKLNFLYYPMDHAVFTKYMYEAMGRNECQQSGVGSTGAIACSKLLKFDSAGIIHCGLCGGELMGDLIGYSKKGYSGYYLCRLGLKEWEDEKCIFDVSHLMDNFRSCQNLTHIFSPDCEVISPFLDEDVVEFVLQLPPKYLIRRKLYREWMVRYLNNPYTSTFFQGPITISPVREYIVKASRRAQKYLQGKSKSEMNPFDYWFRTNDELCTAVSEKFESDIADLQRNGLPSEVLSLIGDYFKMGSLQKCYVLTATYALINIVT